MLKTIIIMAAGNGTRMLELSKDRPKHLIGVKNQPFLFYSLKNIKAAGFEKIILVVGYKKEKMEEFAREYSDKFNLILVDQFKEVGTEKYGTACPVEAVQDVVGNQNFVVVNGDDLYSVNDLKIIRKLEHDYCYVAGFRHQDPSPYGLHHVDENGFLIDIIEKPKPGIDFDSSRPLDYSVNIGMYKFTPEIFAAVKKINKSPRGEYEITDAITLLAKQKKVKVVQIKDGWKSFTNPADVEKMEQVV